MLHFWLIITNYPLYKYLISFYVHIWEFCAHKTTKSKNQGSKMNMLGSRTYSTMYLSGIFLSKTAMKDLIIIIQTTVLALEQATCCARDNLGQAIRN